MGEMTDDQLDSDARVQASYLTHHEARRVRITCTCGHAFSSHRQDPVDPWVSERCKTCGCAAFDDGRRSGGWDDDDE